MRREPTSDPVYTAFVNCVAALAHADNMSTLLQPANGGTDESLESLRAQINSLIMALGDRIHDMTSPET